MLLCVTRFRESVSVNKIVKLSGAEQMIFDRNKFLVHDSPSFHLICYDIEINTTKLLSVQTTRAPHVELEPANTHAGAHQK